MLPTPRDLEMAPCLAQGPLVEAATSHVLVPINERPEPEEIEEAFRQAAEIGIRCLVRGPDFGRLEQIHRQDLFSNVKYGIGENRYVFSKA